MKITEIETLSDLQFDDWIEDTKLVPNKFLKKLPGNNPYYYTFIDGDALTIWHNKNPVAKLGISKMRDSGNDSFPIENAYMVLGIGVLPEYQGQNLAKSLYGLVLLPPPIGLGATLLSDTSQTQGGKRNWGSLARIPGVEVTGLISIQNYVRNEVDIEFLEDLFGKLGGVYIGESESKIYYQFPVSVSDNQIQVLIKSSKVSIYDKDYYGIKTRLMARYIG
jgi:hypothetical protein